MPKIDLIIPQRGKRLYVFPVFTLIKPLQRPRLNKHKNGIYQPKINQSRLLESLKFYKKIGIDNPCIIDVYINMVRQQNDTADYPNKPRYGDEDNLRKAVMDALQDVGILHDDRHILGGATYKVFGEDDFALIEIFDIQTSIVYEAQINDHS